MRTPHRQGHTRWTKLPLVFAVGTLSAAMLAACGSDTTTDTTDGSAGPSNPATASATPTTTDALSGRIVGAEDAPEGLTHEDFYAMFGSTEETPKDTINPPECEPLIFDSHTMFNWGSQARGTTAVSMYNSADGDQTAFIKIEEDAARPVPDAGACATVTTENTSTLGTSRTTYAIAPKELPIEGADTVVAVDQNLQGLTLDDADMSGARAGERTTVVIAQAHGHTITAVGTGDIPDQVITDLVNKQIHKLAS
ncbi:hypothetical protein I4J00_02190 [Corynebacterium diphtheriae bv. gravis]|uniref:hypothetical protein n=1 Tax=Corynebacterium diphtheriae TaxID=1717 RepID=UPI0013CADB5F|nr:hypothetical protein [Corynebacterium diphtheriae]MBG9295825.1 hypothetical protein [Corynebacterium diphtheriae bv. gravis]CAB0716717.1 hypothetical protein FRC0037_02319 [Corynebacterium diphtheriae]CAB0716877.1 hypothetical protein FRC0031_02322 [Corynebacterium diphtheriae]CAB0717357.1 hypothetical protein FRC0038_02330 [Corynebacterium diphtheriae]CAB0765243.1 hypothetical protein FRC0167_00139 [Corynebacterium diphtheriae]